MIGENHNAQYIYAVSNPGHPFNLNTVIGRYFSKEGFVDLLSSSQLRFTNLKDFEDCAEGIPLYQDLIASLNDSTLPITPEYKEAQINAILQTIRNYYASCWMMKEKESYLMWKNYSCYHEGILLFTTAGQLLNSLVLSHYENAGENNTWFYGEVDYGYYTPDISDHRRAFGKGHAFDEEKEFRIVLYKQEVPAEHDQYIFVPMTNFNFINKIVCSPNANESFIEEIKQIANDAGLNSSLVHRSIIKNDSRKILKEFIENTSKQH